MRSLVGIGNIEGVAEPLFCGSRTRYAKIGVPGPCFANDDAAQVGLVVQRLEAFQLPTVRRHALSKLVELQVSRTGLPGRSN